MPKRSKSFRSRLIIGFAASTFLVILITVVSYINLNKLEDEHQWVNHTQTVIQASTDLLQLITDAETSARGYFGTKDELFIKPYQDALSQIDPQYDKLAASVTDNPDQVRMVEELRQHIELKKNVMASYVSQRRESGLQNSIPIDRVIKGKVAMDKIRQVIRIIISEEKKLLADRQSASESASQRASVTLLSGALIFLIIIILLFLYIRWTFAQRELAELQVQKSNHELHRALSDNNTKNWLLTGLRQLADRMQGQQNETDLATNVLKELIDYTKGVTGTLYLFDKETKLLNYCAGYAFEHDASVRKQVHLSETWIGQTAQLKSATLISGQLTKDLTFSSSIIQKQLVHCFLVPFFYEQELKGVIELGYWQEPEQYQQDYIRSAVDNIGIAMNTAQARSSMTALYAEIQQQAEELEVQQEELRAANEELVLRAETGFQRRNE